MISVPVKGEYLNLSYTTLDIGLLLICVSMGDKISLMLSDTIGC